MSRLGETIRAARLKKGLTPKALGKKCGVALKWARASCPTIRRSAY